MFRKIADTAQSLSYRIAKKLDHRCRSCGKDLALPQELPASQWEHLVTCSHCQWSASLSELLTKAGDMTQPLMVQPPASKIKKSAMNGEKIWEIPGTRRPSFLWFFSLIWCAFSFSLFGIVLLAKPVASNDSPLLVKFGALAFMVPFIAVGLGTLYAAMARTFQVTQVVFDMHSIRIRKKLFGVTRERSFLKKEIKNVLVAQSHRENNSSVYHLYLVSDQDKKHKVALVSSNDEKRWLLGQWRQVLSLPLVPETRIEEFVTASQARQVTTQPYHDKTMKITPAVDGFFTIERPISVKPWFLVAGLFLVIGTVLSMVLYFSEISDQSNRLRLPVLVQYLPFAISLLCFLVGIRSLGKVRRYIFMAETLEVQVWRWSKLLSGEIIPRTDLHSVDCSQSGHSNGVPRYRVALQGRKSLSLCHFISEESATTMSNYCRAWLTQTEHNATVNSQE